MSVRFFSVEPDGALSFTGEPQRFVRRFLMLASAVVVAAFLIAGCLTKTMRVPVEDHAVQMRVIADACKADGYGVGKCTQEDLEAMAEQADCIDAVVKKQHCDEERPAGEGESDG